MTEPIPLSPEDLTILDLEGPTVVGHTCKVIRVGPPGVEFDALFGMVDRRVGDVPELRYRLSDDSGSPAWVADGDFQLEQHLTLAGDGTEIAPAEVPVLAAKLFARHLDRDRPLWAMDVFRLEDGGAAIVWRIHHALADGSTAMRFAREVLWHEDAGAAPPADPPARQADHARRRVHLTHVIEHEFGRSGGPSPFDGRIGAERAIAMTTVPLGELHDAAKRTTGATLNDAVLSVVAGAIGHWMGTHDHQDLGEIRVKVPVSLHQADGDAGNRDSYFTVPLPLGEPDPVARLEQIRDETAERKSEHEAEELDRLFQRFAHLSPRLGHFLTRVEANPRRFALNVSNVHGPTHPVKVLDSPVDSVHSIAEIARRHALRVSVVSVGDQLNFGFCADPDLVTDLDAMAEGAELAADRLIDSAG